MLKQALSNQLTDLARVLAPSLLGDAWRTERVPVWIERLALAGTATDGQDEVVGLVTVDGACAAEFYAATPYDLVVEPLVICLSYQALNPAAPGWNVRARLIELNEFTTQDGALSVARLRFKLTGTCEPPEESP